MRISVSITHYPGEEAAERLIAVGHAADEGGLDTVWVADHLRQVAPGSHPTDTMLEAGTVLGFLAAATSRVRLGMMVGALTFRPPSILIKAVTTLDVLSGGRAWFGIGIGHDAAEAAASGIPFPPARRRYAQLEDTLALARRMWSGEARPVPTTRPHPPILIGGHGERRTLPLVAQHADACNLFDIPDGGATLRHKLRLLDDLCVVAGRAPGDVERTVNTWLRPGESISEFTDRCAALATLGVDHVVAITPIAWSDEVLEILTNAAQHLRTAEHG